jgi:hypothetical protein
MTTTTRHDDDPPSLPRTGAGMLAASIAAAAIVGLLTLLTLLQSAPHSMQTLVPTSADNGGAPPRDAALPLDAGVDWQRVERAPLPDGASVAAYER